MMIAREYSPIEGARDCKKQVVAEIFSFNATRIKLKLVEEKGENQGKHKSRTSNY
jgi:hypothetical protein